MAEDLDRRTYDILRLIDAHGPIGSIRLVDLLQRYGYSIKGRTVRLILSELDDAGLTEKIPGKGRKLTEAGRSELGRGDVSGRLEQVRERIATLTSRVTYDPLEDAGEVIACAAHVPRSNLEGALESLASLSRTPLAPVLVAVEDDAADAPPGTARLLVPSSITLGGILLSRGIENDLKTAGLVEYHPDPDPSEVPYGGGADPDRGGTVLRYVDAISGKFSTMDVVSLLIGAGRTTVRRTVAGNHPGLFVVDYREFPLTRYEETRDLSLDARANLGGVLDVRRPRENGPFPRSAPGWEFASLTYGGIGETAISLLAEEGCVDSWTTLHGLVPRAAFESVRVVRAERGPDG
ncbi:NrpR regulatory domain-containing protein [Halegenticoccus soli]|uniref:NrpR regulatory domain-containing protein n=1 Tax=Halegenticoccus soli TaxID=1985678 RepID=UPI000C6D0AD7|nr:NrpR regulatory domain-containing protein [Halegenticoccus soli]